MELFTLSGSHAAAAVQRPCAHRRYEMKLVPQVHEDLHDSCFALTCDTHLCGLGLLSRHAVDLILAWRSVFATSNAPGWRCRNPSLLFSTVRHGICSRSDLPAEVNE